MTPWLDRNQRALEVLTSLPWARKLVRGINDRGISRDTDDFLFELRYAHDAARAGLQLVYEHPTGVGGSTVDFMLPADVPWLVELVSVRESDHVKAATVTETVASGVSISTTMLSSHAGLVDPARARQTPQYELLRVTQKIGEKVFNGRKPIKFPAPDGSAFHMILVDMRGFEGDGHPDRDHCRQIVGGPGMVKEPAFVAYFPETGEPIRGVWDQQNKSQAAILMRERIHVIGFVHEELYADDEIRDVTVSFLNPAFFQESQFAPYPLRAPEGAVLAARTTNSLWRNG